MRSYLYCLLLLLIAASVRADSISGVTGQVPSIIGILVGTTFNVGVNVCSTSGQTRVTVDVTTMTTAANWYGKGTVDITAAGCTTVTVNVAVANLIGSDNIMLKLWTAPISAFSTSTPWTQETAEQQISVGKNTTPASTASSSSGSSAPSGGSTTGGNTPPPSSSTYPTSSIVGKYDYKTALDYSWRFYEAQRAGKLPSTNRIPYRGDSVLKDGSDVGLDLSKGWFDAGDHVKFSFPMSYSSTILAWGLYEYQNAYKNANLWASALDGLKWSTDFYITSHSGTNELVGQVGNGGIDHAVWERPEDIPSSESRPTYKVNAAAPGSDLAGNMASALAAMSILYQSTDATYAASCLSHAQAIFTFGSTYLGKYSDSISDAKNFYASSGFRDELVLAAVWLYKATGTATYLNYAETNWASYSVGNNNYAMSWDDVSQVATVMLWKITGKAVYASAVESFLNAWLPGGSVQRTPKGLAWRSQWGSLRYSANTALVAFVYGDSIYSSKSALAQNYHDFAVGQMHYILGDTGRSFVVGFGVNPPKRAHHTAASCPNRPAACGWNEYNANVDNPQILYGAVVGGPAADDSYNDVRSDYVQNEVACDYNAAYTGGLARLYMETTGNAPAADSGTGTPSPVLTSSGSSGSAGTGTGTNSGGSTTAGASGEDLNGGSTGTNTNLILNAATAVQPAFVGLLAIVVAAVMARFF